MKREMRTKSGLGIVLGLFFIAFVMPFFVLGNENEAQQRKAEDLARIEREFEKYQHGLDRDFSNQKYRENARLSSLRQRIERELQLFESNRNIHAETEEKLKVVRKEITTFGGQIRVLDILLEGTKREVSAVKKQIQSRIADLKKLTEEAELLRAKEKVQLRALVSFFALLQKENEGFAVEDEMRNFIRVLLSDDSFSEMFWKEQRLLAVEKVGRDVFYEMKRAQYDVEEVTGLISRENKKLQTLYAQKKQNENRLEMQRAAKKELQQRAQKSEDEFQKLLDESRVQMEESGQVIVEMKKNKARIEERLTEVTRKAVQKKKELLAERDEILKKVKTEEMTSTDIEEFLQRDKNGIHLQWPIIPKYGISAYYLDKEYEKIFHVPHEAIDIPANQGTIVTAPLLGYVYKVSDNGMGYNSLVLAHRNNLTTLYGHVSKFLVKEGDLVKTGDPIALVGGTPGTKGAGYMTTGAHLHFEMFQNEVHVNPLDFLSMEEGEALAQKAKEQ